MQRLSKKIAIVTGAAQGLGAAFARALAVEGAKIVIADIGDGTEVVNSIACANGSAIYVKTDVSAPEQVRAMVDRAVSEFGGVDILINNAAVFASLGFKKFQDISSAEFDHVMAINVRGPFECAKAVAPIMIARGGGKIVNIASSTVFKGVPNLLHYVSSKGAVVAMTRCLARELGDQKIAVNAIAPGLTMSDGVLGQPGYSTQYIDANVNARALKRRQRPDDLVGAMIFLCSSDSDFMTGQTMAIDGGNIMH